MIFMTISWAMKMKRRVLSRYVWCHLECNQISIGIGNMIEGTEEWLTCFVRMEEVRRYA